MRVLAGGVLAYLVMLVLALRKWILNSGRDAAGPAVMEKAKVVIPFNQPSGRGL